jgi:tryptophan synthase alpha chain
MSDGPAAGAGPDAASRGRLQGHLRARRAEGRKLLVPYVTGGIRPDWLELVEALADGGADAIEIGLPFSDPAMDGPTIQEASVRSLKAGSTPTSILGQLRSRQFGVPLIAMTYYNLVFRAGHTRFAGACADAGVVATILPDLPLELAGDWIDKADAAGIENVLLVSPVTSDERLARLVAATRGFVYGVSVMGTTGERASLAATAGAVAARIKAATDKPALIGFGISTAVHALEATEIADGVVVASALMRRMLDGENVEAVASLVAEMRSALDGR